MNVGRGLSYSIVYITVSLRANGRAEYPNSYGGPVGDSAVSPSGGVIVPDTARQSPWTPWTPPTHGPMHRPISPMHGSICMAPYETIITFLSMCFVIAETYAWYEEAHAWYETAYASVFMTIHASLCIGLIALCILGYACPSSSLQWSIELRAWLCDRPRESELQICNSGRLRALDYLHKITMPFSPFAYNNIAISSAIACSLRAQGFCASASTRQRVSASFAATRI